MRVDIGSGSLSHWKSLSLEGGVLAKMEGCARMASSLSAPLLSEAAVIRAEIPNI